MPFAAANFVTSTPDGDERDYARLVASALGLELAELPEEAAELDLSPTALPTLRPPLSTVLQPLHTALSRHARDVGSANFMTGAGGDNVFCYLTTTAPILDATSALGLRAAWPAVRDVATLGECTVWKAADYALRKRFRGRRPAWKRDERFLAACAAVEEPDPHPWLERPDDAQPGTIEHVESLVLVQHFLEPEYSSGEALHHPLINQPLIELCLGIPTWLWLRGGRNRAVARAAFADLLPSQIVRRRSKGRLESMCARAYVENCGRLRDLLLGGELARRGLLDRPTLEAYLRPEERPRDDSYFRVFDLASLELWLRSSLP